MRRLIVALLVCLMASGGIPARGQDEADKRVGRYQVVPVTPAHFVMIDTTTGECWTEDDGKWLDLKFPVKETKVAQGDRGRFRLEPIRNKDGETTALVVCDTVVGRCWRAGYDPGSMIWRAIPSPRPK